VTPCPSEYPCLETSYMMFPGVALLVAARRRGGPSGSVRARGQQDGEGGGTPNGSFRGGGVVPRLALHSLDALMKKKVLEPEPSRNPTRIAPHGRKRELVFDSLNGIAEFFGVSLSMVKHWSAEGMPRGDDGWTLSKIYPWFERRMEERIARIRGKGRSKRKTESFRAKLLELEYRERMAGLVDRSSHEGLLRTVEKNMRSTLSSLATELADEDPGLDQRGRLARIQARFSSALEHLAEHAGDSKAAFHMVETR
jgi:hypothetical protein